MLYDGQDAFEMGEEPLARFRNRNVGFVFQFHYLLPEFTALENTAMPGLISRLPRAEAEQVAEGRVAGQIGAEHHHVHEVAGDAGELRSSGAANLHATLVFRGRGSSSRSRHALNGPRDANGRKI